MNEKTEEMRMRMKALQFPADALSNVSNPTAAWQSPASSSAGRSARPKPSLNVTGPYTSSGGGTSANRRPLPASLQLTPSPGGDRLRLATGNEEQERKLKEIMSQNGILQINGKTFRSRIDDLELLGDLGNGTCGHVVEMRHRESSQVIAVKQMRRTGNSDENKRILMDLDVVLKSHDCEQIVLCLGCFITDSDVWICMELMATCFDKLLKQLKQPIPEAICGKVAVATLKALNYLKENHGVIHRDVKPSNILLDANGRVKLCDFGISGRLVDSKAKTRSAGCAAYMAPERIDPPNPNKPDYDIRADVWSLGITLVELATGHFPYRDCKTDFEVLTKVLQESPPLLPRNGGFSAEFCSFVQDCLMKNYKDRPKYRKLLLHPFIKKYEREEVDVGAWYRSHLKNFNNALTTTPNNNQITYDPLPAQNLSSLDRTFKPQPSPRIVRARRQTSQPSASTTTSAYPSAIAERERDRRPSFEVLMENRRIASSAGHDYPSSRSDTVTSKPPPALPSPSDPVRAFSGTPKHHLHPSVSLGDGSSVLGRANLPSASHSSSASQTASRNVYERWNPTNGGLNYPSGASSTSSHLSTPSRTGYGVESDASKNYSSSMYYQSPRVANKFEFTFPSTSYVTGGASSASTSSPHHRHLNFSSSVTSTPSSVRRTSAEHHHLPHHVAYQPHHFAGAASLPPSATVTTTDQSKPSRERLSRLDTAASAATASPDSTPSHLLASPPSPSRERSYFPSSWRSTLSSWTTSWQSPLSLRRLRTASTDRSSGFDSTRRFQPSYRSWNEKDNYYGAMKR